MTTNKTTGLTRSKWDRSQGLGVRHRIARTTTITGVGAAYATYLTVPIGHVALIDEISIVKNMATAAATAQESVTIEFTNFEDQTGVWNATRPGNGGAPDGLAATDAAYAGTVTEVPFFFTKAIRPGATDGQGDNRFVRYHWKLNGDLCLASGVNTLDGQGPASPAFSTVNARTAQIRVKASPGTSGDQVHIQYRLMTRAAAIAQGEFKKSFIRCTALPVATAQTDVIKPCKNMSIEINAIAATGNARTTATIEDVKLSFADPYGRFSSLLSAFYDPFFRVYSKSNTAVSVHTDAATFLSGLKIRGQAENKVTALGSANVASTMAVALVGRYVLGRDDADLPSQGVNYTQSVTLASGTASAGGASTLTVEVGRTLAANVYTRHRIKITAGTGAGQVRMIASNTAGPPGVITIGGTWDTNPDATSQYQIFYFKTRHETWDAAGLPASSGGIGVQSLYDVFGYERGSKYFWAYSELTATGDESVFPITPGAPVDGIIDAVGKVRGYYVSTVPQTAGGLLGFVYGAGGAGEYPLTEMFGANITAQSVTYGRDDLLLPFSTSGKCVAANGSDSTTLNLSITRQFASPTANANTQLIWGTLEANGSAAATPVPGGATGTGGIKDYYSGA